MAETPRAEPTTKEKILQAAIAEFADKGLGGARVDAIAERAGVNKAMIYYHFRSKEDLYWEIVRDVLSPLVENLYALQDTPEEPAEALRHFLEMFCNYVYSHRRYARILLREMISDPQRFITESPVFGEFERIGRVLAEAVKKGEKKGVFRKLDADYTLPSLLGPVLFIALAGPIWQAIGNRNLDDPDTLRSFIEHVTSVFFSGVIPGGGRN